MPASLKALLPLCRAFLTRGVGFALVAVSQLILAKVLSVSDFGKVSYLFGILSLAMTVCCCGGNMSLIRYVAKAESRAALVSFFKSLAVLAAALLAICILVLFLLPLLNLPLSEGWRFILEVRGLAFLLLAVMTAHRLLVSVFFGRKRTDRGFLHDTITRCGLFLLMLGGLWLVSGGVTAFQAVILTLISYGAALFIGGLDLRRFFQSFKGVAAPLTLKGLKAHLPVHLSFASASVSQLLNNRLAFLLAGVFLPTQSLGLLALAMRLSGLVAMGLSVTNTVIAPHIAALHDKDNAARDRLITLAAWGNFALALLAATVFAVAGRWALSFFGAEYVQAYPLLLILLGGQLVNTACGSVGYALNMTGHERYAALGYGLALVISAPLSLALILWLKLTGAALALSVSLAVLNLVLLGFNLKKAGINPSIFKKVKLS